jgi:hypothetical protein
LASLRIIANIRKEKKTMEGTEGHPPLRLFLQKALNQCDAVHRQKSPPNLPLPRALRPTTNMNSRGTMQFSYTRFIARDCAFDKANPLIYDAFLPVVLCNALSWLPKPSRDTNIHYNMVLYMANRLEVLYLSMI